MQWVSGRLRIGLFALCLLPYLGCSRPQDTSTVPAHPFQGLKLTVGVVGEPKLAETLSSVLIGEWRETRKADVTVARGPTSAKEAARLDVLVFPAELLGDLVDNGALMTWPEKLVNPPPPPENPGTETERPTDDDMANPYQFADVLEPYREQVTKYGKDRKAVPLGGSGLVLVFDRGAFDRPENQEAADDAGIALEPPRTWEALDALARFFNGRDWDGDGKPDHGIALALAADQEGLANDVHLARAASLGQHKDQYSFFFDSDSMAPRIDTPPFVEALTTLIALKECGPPKMETFDAAAARRAFADGEVALLIDRAEQSAHWVKDKPVGLAALPGSERVFDPARKEWETPTALNQPSYLPRGGGWLVGVSSATKGARRDAAVDFAKYLTSPELATQVRSNPDIPMLPVRSTAVGLGPVNSNGVDARQWSDAVGRTLAAERVIPGLRIPEATGYLSDLTSGRLSALKGEPAEKALHQVAVAWQARTQRLGTARQAWHYQRSLNTLVTSPEPPPR